MGGDIYRLGSTRLSRRNLTAVVLILFACIFGLRLLTDDPAAGLTFLFVLPIVLTAVEWGRRAGIAAGLLGLALYGVWVQQSGDVASPLAYLTRGLVFVSIGAFTGELADRLRRATESMRVSARHFDLSKDMLATANFEGYLVHLNDSWTEILGWSREELMERPFVEFVHPDDRESTEREAAALADGVSAVSFTNRYATKDGGWRWVEWSSKADLQRGLIYAAARDVTERREAEQAREEAEERFRLAFEDSAIGMAVVGVSGEEKNRVIEANDALCRITGYPREKLVGRLTLAYLTHPHDAARIAGEMRKLLEGESRVMRAELRLVHSSGEPRWVELTTSLVRNEHGEPIYRISQVIDVSARKEAEDAMRRAHEQAVEASRMKSDFVANMSHEIRTPLNGVLGLTDLLLDTELSDDQRHYAESLRSSGDALMNVIDDILDFSKIEAGKLELEASDFSLRGLLEGATTVVAPAARKKGLELLAWCDPEVDDGVRGDPGRIRQVLTNLLSNAVKFTAKGEVFAHVTQVEDTAKGPVLRFEVKDTGIGIEPEALDSLFESFVQADSSTTRKYGGTGLGLTISKQLVDLMGGDIGVESEPGQGSRFWFTVPLLRAELPAEPAVADFRDVRVLVVDDNDTNRTILERQLSSWGMRCDTAASPTDGLELLDRAVRDGQPYGLALLDFQLPEMNGLELAAAIKERPGLRALPTVLLSSGGTTRESARAAGIDGMLDKPVGQSSLQDEIARVLNGSRREAPTPVLPETPDGAKANGRSLRVLVAEDHPVNQLVAVRQLEGLGCEVEVAKDGHEAVRMTGERDYSAVFMDCQMPGLDGYEATGEIRRREQAGGGRLPIVAMTAHTMEGDREKCLAAGMDDYVAKPLQPGALEQALQRVAGHATNGSSATVDRAKLREVATVGGPDTDLVALFLDDARSRVAAMREALDRGDDRQAGQLAHALKGSSAMVGATRLAQACDRLEHPPEGADLGQLGYEIAQTLDITETALKETP